MTRSNRPQRSRRRRSIGQVMVIFALMSVMLFAIVGLAIDAGLSYFSYNGAERAAAAAALAGAPYMPAGCQPGANSNTCPSTGAADKAVKAASAREGFGNNTTVNGKAVTVTDSQYPAGCGFGNGPSCDSNKITASVTVNVQSTFLRVLGFGDHWVTVSDTAFYLPPITLGQPGSQLGSDLGSLGTAGNYYFLRSEGYGNDRTEGDAFDPYNQNQTFSSSTCDVAETTAGHGSSTDVHQLSSNLSTDLQDWQMTNAGLNALPHGGGYNFAMVPPTSVASSYAQVFNPAFSPDGGYNPGSNSAYNMHEQDGSFSGNTYTKQYSGMEYTLFQVQDVFDHTQDTPLAQVIYDPLNVTVSGGNVTQIDDPALGVTLPNSVRTTVMNSIYHQWVNVVNPPTVQWTSGGTTYKVVKPKQTLSSGHLTGGVRYRLRVDMLDYQNLRPVDDASLGAVPCSRAHKGYAVRLATFNSNNSTYSPCSDPNCSMSAIDELALFTPIQASSGTAGFSIPIFSLPADYKGTTVDLFVYDPGDLSGGSNTLSIINPEQAGDFAVTAPAKIPIYDVGVSRNTPPTSAMLVNNQYSCGGQLQASPNNTAAVSTIVAGCSGNAQCGSNNTNCNVFNSHWLLFQLPIPSNYAGGGGNYWKLNYTVGNGATATDTITVVVGYEGAPVHLLG